MVCAIGIVWFTSFGVLCVCGDVGKVSGLSRVEY